MSMRAYRVIEIKMEVSSFNLWHDRALINFLDEEAQFSANLSSDGTGLAEVPVKMLERAVRMSAKLNLAEETVKRVQQDIAAAKSNGDESVTYYCY